MKLGLGVLTLVNVALTCFGVSMAMMSPMLFDSGGQDDQLLWAVFWSIFVFPAVALICVFVPWLFLWLKWPRTALFAAIIPLAWLAAVFGVIFSVTSDAAGSRLTSKGAIEPQIWDLGEIIRSSIERLSIWTRQNLIEGSRPTQRNSAEQARPGA